MILEGFYEVKMKRRLLIIFILFIIPIFGRTAEQRVELSDMLKLAEERNPALKSYSSLTNAQSYRVGIVQNLPDPSVEFGFKNAGYAKFTLGKEDMSAITFSVSENIPFPGKLRIMGDIEENKLTMSKERLKSLKLSIKREIKELYSKLFYYTKSIEIFIKKKEYLKKGLKLAETKYSLNLGNQSDIFRANLEINKIDEMLILMERMKDETISRLKSIMDYPDVLILADKEISLENFDYKISTLSDETIKSSPILEESRTMVEEGSNEVKLAKREYYPNIMLKAGNDFRGSLDGAYEVMVGIEIPIFFKRKQSNMVKGALEKHRSLKDGYVAMKNEIINELNEVFIEANASQNLIKLYKEKILPQASLTIESSLANYQYDKVDFLTLISDIDNLYSYEIDYYKELSNLWINTAKIEEITTLKIIK